MAAVAIYAHKKLELIVLPNRKILSRGKAISKMASSIHQAEKSPYWKNKQIRNHIRVSGFNFYKEIDMGMEMDDDDSEMSDSFFLYLAFHRFQNQAYQARFIPDEMVKDLLDKSNSQSNNLSKLLALETAIEYLIKAPKKELEYVEDPSQVPDDTPVITTDRGATAYRPDQVGSKASAELPSEEREIEGVIAEEADDADEDGDIGVGIGEKIGEEAFIARVKSEGLIAVEELIKTLPKISLDEQKELTRQAALAGKGLQTDKTPITPNIAVVNADGKVVKISSADGQLQAVSFGDDAKKGGKFNIYFSSDPDAKVQVKWRDNKGRQNSAYGVAHIKSRSLAKFGKMGKLAKRIPKLESQVKKDIKEATRRVTREAAYAVGIINNTFRRVGKGNSTVTWDGKEGRPGPKKDKEDNFIRESVPTFGVTSFEARHMIVKDNKLFLHFLGKSGKLNHVEVTDPLVKKELVARKKTLKKTDKVINVSPASVNAYLKKIVGDEFSIKNFRTYHGTRLAYDIISNSKIPSLTSKKNKAEFTKFATNLVAKGVIKTSQDFKESAFLWALKEHHKLKLELVGEPVSKQLSNTKEVCITNYIDPALFEDWDAAFKKQTNALMALDKDFLSS